MDTILIQISDNLIAQVKIYYPTPVTLTPNYETKHWDASRLGKSISLSESTVLEYFEDVFKHVKEVLPIISKVTFLQNKYKKKPFTLLRGEWELIERTVAEAPPRKFKSAEDMYLFCQPDYVI